MKTSTLFSAYVKATRMCEVCRAAGPTSGILVKNDFWSLQCQRYDRLVRKLEKRIKERLQEAEK